MFTLPKLWACGIFFHRQAHQMYLNTSLVYVIMFGPWLNQRTQIPLYHPTSYNSQPLIKSQFPKINSFLILTLLTYTTFIITYLQLTIFD